VWALRGLAQHEQNQVANSTAFSGAAEEAGCQAWCWAECKRIFAIM